MRFLFRLSCFLGNANRRIVKVTVWGAGFIGRDDFSSRTLIMGLYGLFPFTEWLGQPEVECMDSVALVTFNPFLIIPTFFLGPCILASTRPFMTNVLLKINVGTE